MCEERTNRLPPQNEMTCNESPSFSSLLSLKSFTAFSCSHFLSLYKRTEMNCGATEETAPFTSLMSMEEEGEEEL